MNTIQDHFFSILSEPKATQKGYMMCKLPFMSMNLCCESAENKQGFMLKQVLWLCDCSLKKKEHSAKILFF